MASTTVIIPDIHNETFPLIKNYVPQETEIILLPSKETRAFNEGIRSARGEYIILALPNVKFFPYWYDELIKLVSDRIGVIAPRNQFPPFLLLITREVIESAGGLDEDLEGGDAFAEYLSRIIESGWSVRFASWKEDCLEGPLAKNSSNFLVLKILRKSFSEIPEPILLDVPLLANIYYDRGDIMEALRWTSNLAMRNYQLAGKWWQDTIHETPLSLQEFQDLLEYLDERYVAKRNLALSKMHLSIGRLDLAVTYLTTSLGNGASDAESYYLLGEIARLQNLLEDAEIMYKQSLKVRPGFSPAQEQLSRLNVHNPANNTIHPQGVSF